MLSVVAGLLRIFFPALKEWMKSKKLGPKLDKSLKEINQIFLMNILLVALFFASVEHGVFLYANYTDRLREAAYVRRETEYLNQRLKELQDHNQYLRGRYVSAMMALEEYADEDPQKILRRLEETGTAQPVEPEATEPNQPGLR